jgi:hypothetical protein
MKWRAYSPAQPAASSASAATTPLARERLEARPDGTLTQRVKAPWRDGTAHILMERRELIERLIPLVPPPRAQQVRYHGILAPGAGDLGASEEPTELDRAATPQEPEAPRDKERQMRWAARLRGRGPALLAKRL